MKTADEYALAYEMSARNRDALTAVLIGMLADVKEVAEAGGPSDKKLFRALNTMNTKWESFARRFKEAQPSGFQNFVKLRMPDVYDGWMRDRGQKPGGRNCRDYQRTRPARW